jgi:hypothetical protein
MDMLILIFIIGFTGLLFGMLTAYPVDKLKPHPIWRIAVSLVLTFTHACLWMLLAYYMDPPNHSNKNEYNSREGWVITLLGSLSVAVVHLDKRAERPFIPDFLRRLFSKAPPSNRRRNGGSNPPS